MIKHLIKFDEWMNEKFANRKGNYILVVGVVVVVAENVLDKIENPIKVYSVFLIKKFPVILVGADKRYKRSLINQSCDVEKMEIICPYLLFQAWSLL